MSEVAKEFGLTPEAVRQRLKKCEGDMQKVYDHYDTERAIAQLMNAVNPETEAETTAHEPEPKAEPTPKADIGSESELPEAPEVEKENPLAALGRLNRAIDALSGVYEADVGGMADELIGFIRSLRIHRAIEFERYVDWAGIEHERRSDQ